MSRWTARPVRVLAACLVQAVLVAVAVWPQLSARTAGEEYLLAVAPVDPIDPFRGAYVALEYPGLAVPLPDGAGVATGAVHVPLEPVAGTDLWQGRAARPAPPKTGPYLRCTPEGVRLRCGIESLFAAQEEALRLERELVGGAVARVRIGPGGSASVVAVEPAR